MKFLKDDEFAVLKAKADNYDTVVDAVVANNPELNATDVTPEVIAGAISEGGTTEDNSVRITELETEVSTLTDTVEELTTERNNLQEQVEALSVLPGAESASVKKPKAELNTAETNELLEFASKNKNNPVAVAAKMREEGLIK